MNKIEMVSPLELNVGDVVEEHGARFEIATKSVREWDGRAVASCFGRLIGEATGSIPAHWLDTPEQMVPRGYTNATAELSPGRYWTIQGNDSARVCRVV